jgi:hypothetical protein
VWTFANMWQNAIFNFVTLAIPIGAVCGTLYYWLKCKSDKKLVERIQRLREQDELIEYRKLKKQKAAGE